MQINLETPSGLEEELKMMVLEAAKSAMELYKNSLVSKEWFSLREAQDYIGVSNVTFSKFRTMGLKVMEVDSVKRVSKKELDRFMEENSY